jgi:hypothetical protein
MLPSLLKQILKIDKKNKNAGTGSTIRNGGNESL